MAALQEILTRLKIKRSGVYAPYAIALLFIAVLGGLFGLVLGRASDAGKGGDENWTLPAWQQAQAVSPDGLEAIAGTFFTEGPRRTIAKTAPVVAQAWQFVGTTREGERLLAIIVGGQPSRVWRLAAGEKLPNGERIEGIETGRLRYVDDAGARERMLFNREERQQ